MKTELKIYIDRLRDGEEAQIQEIVGSSILELTEPTVQFSPTISVSGTAYLADDHLILQLTLQTQVTLPCPICNNPVPLPFIIKQFIHTLPLASIPTHVYDYTDEVREVILLNTPEFAECHDGKCPEREHITAFIKKKGDTLSHVQYPFSDLD